MDPVARVRQHATSGVRTYTLRACLTDEETSARTGKICPGLKAYSLLIDHDADCYDERGKLLLRFRKRVLPLAHIGAFYHAVIKQARLPTHNRPTALSGDGGSSLKSSVYGYMDSWTAMQQHMFQTLGISVPPVRVRTTAFTASHPDLWAQAIPLITSINRHYKRLMPLHHRFQVQHALATPYHIADTAFTTVTTNLNTQMAYHRDAGNLDGSSGNLVVIEKGKYSGGVLVFPQFRVGVDVRMGDFLGMDVHQLHGNTALRLQDPKTAERLSVVCYMRKGIWEKSRGAAATQVKRGQVWLAKTTRAYYDARARRSTVQTQQQP